MSSLRWKVAPAGPCSSSCGLGLAVQLVTCVQIHQGKEILLEEHLCPVAEKPLTSVPCVIRMCSYEWSFSEWTEVFAPVQMRHLASICSGFIAIHFPKAYRGEIPLLPCIFTSHRNAKVFLGMFSILSTALCLAAIGLLPAFLS